MAACGSRLNGSRRAEHGFGPAQSLYGKGKLWAVHAAGQAQQHLGLEAAGAQAAQGAVDSQHRPVVGVRNTPFLVVVARINRLGDASPATAHDLGVGHDAPAVAAGARSKVAH